MTPKPEAHPPPLSLGFSRQQYWSGLPFPSPKHDAWCMISRFSCVWLCMTLWTVAHQAPLSTGFFRQEYWSGLPFPSPFLYAQPFAMWFCCFNCRTSPSIFWIEAWPCDLLWLTGINNPEKKNPKFENACALGLPSLAARKFSTTKWRSLLLPTGGWEPKEC